MAGAELDDAVFAITTTDVRAGCDVLRPVRDRTDGIDGKVSIEVDPRLAGDTDATVHQTHALWDEVGRPNLMVKIPATTAGLPAITAAIAGDISVNVTLIFSLDRYRQVVDAFALSLEQAWRTGRDLSSMPAWRTRSTKDPSRPHAGNASPRTARIRNDRCGLPPQ